MFAKLVSFSFIFSFLNLIFEGAKVGSNRIETDLLIFELKDRRRTNFDDQTHYVREMKLCLILLLFLN